MLYIYGIIGAIIGCISQYLLCIKSKNIKVKLIPLMVIVTLLVLSVLVYFGVFGEDGHFISINAILGILMFINTLIAGAGVILGWIFGFIKTRK